jgi:SpoIID/LytB domain protein
MLSWRLIRRCVAAFLAVALVLFGVYLSRTNGPSANRASISGEAQSTPVPKDAPPAPEPKGPKPVVRTKETVVPNAPAGAAANVVAELPETRTTSYGMVGVTWSAKTTEQDISVAIRSLVKGQWTAWDTLENDDEAPGEGGRPGTEPVWVGEAQGVAVRVSSASGTRPDDIRVLTIDPGGVDGAAAATVTPAGYTTSGVLDGTVHASTAVTTTDGAPSYTPRPTIILRSAWGAATGGTCSAPLTGSSTHGIVVHHTAGSNTYTAADSAKIVRGIQAYHINGHGWCDIGYNFLVDKYGQIFEGRKGGVDRTVRAAHSGNGEVNTYTMGVSMMGDFDTVEPPEALKAAMVKLIGWRMGTTYMKAKGTYSVAENSLTLNLIAGHRNVVSTECPGTYAYAWLSASGGLRDRVEAYIGQYSSAIKTRAAALGTAVTGPVYVGEAPVTGGYRTRFGKLDIYSTSAYGAHPVAGTAFVEYTRLGGSTAKMGLPISDLSVQSSTTKVQRFAAGSIYEVTLSGAVRGVSLWDAFNVAYRALGEANGVLGVPTVSVRAVATGVTRADFSKGYITYSSATHKASAFDSSGKAIAIPASTTTTTGTVPARATGLTAAPSTSGVTVSWSKVAGATSYGVCLKEASASATTCVKRLTNLTATSGSFSGLTSRSGVDYYFSVLSYNAYGHSTSAYLGFELAGTTSADVQVVPATRSFTVTGHGYGHGIGMSQYGASGAAAAGLTYDKILAYYYPGTSTGTKTGNIRVLISKATSTSMIVKALPNMKFRNVATNAAIYLPTTVGGATVKKWRIVPIYATPTKSVLQYWTAAWHTYNTMTWTGDAQIESPNVPLTLELPDGSGAVYRSVLRSAVPSPGSTTRDTINYLSIENYVRGVVAAEMPSGWRQEALRAQAVAARTYGVRAMSATRYYDICDTTSCQVYRGYAAETTATNEAVTATSSKILTSAGTPAFTQFSSSSGGWTMPGSQPYLTGHVDAYDGWSGNPNHTWTVTVSASKLEAKYPAIGSLVSVTVTKRNGLGDWAGRVESVTLKGSSASQVISGAEMRSVLGLRSTWFRFN